jgi:hypothetical protein
MMMDGNSRNNKLLISVVSLEFSRTIFTLLRTISLSFYVRRQRRNGSHLHEVNKVCSESFEYEMEFGCL